MFFSHVGFSGNGLIPPLPLSCAGLFFGFIVPFQQWQVEEVEVKVHPMVVVAGMVDRYAQGCWVGNMLCFSIKAGVSLLPRGWGVWEDITT